MLGLDPDPGALWPVALKQERSPIADWASTAASGEERSPIADWASTAARTSPSARQADGLAAGAQEAVELAGAAVERHCRAAIEAAGPACVAVKLQFACFERLGARGWLALEAVRENAREAGLLVIADAKRGDVPVTASAYAQALVGSTPTPFGEVPGFGADSFTANPLLGRDSLEPLVEGARDAHAGCFFLVNTSNPGAADLQDLDAGGAPLHERIAELVDHVGAAHTGECGLSLVGAVTGATRPERLARLRQLMPRAIFLLPGVGAQGGSAAALGPAFEPHPAAGLVAASRSIVGAHRERGGDHALAAQSAAQELRTLTWNV